MAFIRVIDAELVNAADTGIQPDVFVASAKDDARKLIDDFRKRLPQQTAALEFVQIGSPQTEIVNAAKDWPADLIVIGSHGRGGIKRALLGSVARASCAALPVRFWSCARKSSLAARRLNRQRAIEIQGENCDGIATSSD